MLSRWAPSSDRDPASVAHALVYVPVQFAMTQLAVERLVSRRNHWQLHDDVRRRQVLRRAGVDEDRQRAGDVYSACRVSTIKHPKGMIRPGRLDHGHTYKFNE